MWTAILGFFINTRLGQTIVLAAAITAAVALTWWRIDSVADARGYNRAKAEYTAAQSTLKTSELNKRADQVQGSSQIAAKSDAAAAAVSNTTAKNTQTDKDTIHEEFARQPAVASACTPVPVPAGVQTRIDAAVGRTND